MGRVIVFEVYGSYIPGVAVYQYKPDTERDQPVIDALQKLVERYPRYGFGKIFPILCREGHGWNHKRVHSF